MPDLQLIEETIENALAQDAFELVDMKYLQEGGRWVLRFYVDKHGGITLDDCERISEKIGSILDATDAMTHAYHLEVSSPGVDRIIKKERDFERFSGHRVKVRLKKAVDGRRRYQGYLRGLEAEAVVLESGDSTVRLPLAAIEETRLDPELKV
jgi:ribosome maturation factor RimP